MSKVASLGVPKARTGKRNEGVLAMKSPRLRQNAGEQVIPASSKVVNTTIRS
jgi:hypothetical protein